LRCQNKAYATCVDFERWKSGMCCNVRCLRGVSFHFFLYLSFFLALLPTPAACYSVGDRSQFSLAYRYRLLIYISFSVHFEPPLIANRCYGFGGLFVNQFRQFCADGRNFNQGFSFFSILLRSILYFSEFATVSQKYSFSL